MRTLSPRLAAAGAAYAAALVVGLFAVARRDQAEWTRRDPGEWLAARDLAARAQLDSADLAEPDDSARRKLPDRADLAGRHLLRARKKGQPVSAADVAPLDLGTPAAGTVRFVISAGAADAPVLSLAQPGERLSPCVAVPAQGSTQADWSCGGAPFTVVALHRQQGRGDTLWAVLDAATAEEAAAFAGAAHRLLVRRP